MSATRVSRYCDSQIVAVTAGDTTYIRPVFNNRKDDSPITVRVIADVMYHVAWNRPATATDARVPPDCIEYYDVGPNDVLHFNRGGGAVDGTAWVTEVKLS